VQLDDWDLSFLDLSPDPAVFQGISAIHQDFQSLVTLDKPAQPGEIVHFYAIGLGAVSPSVPTGHRAPANPPAAVVTPIQCSIEDSVAATVSIPVYFAGLAPGLSGIYQISVQLPNVFHLKPGQRSARVGCGIPGKDRGVLVIVP